MVTHGPLNSADSPKSLWMVLHSSPLLSTREGPNILSSNKGNRVHSNVEFSVLTPALPWFHSPYGPESALLKIHKDLALFLKFSNGLPSYQSPARSPFVLPSVFSSGLISSYDWYIIPSFLALPNEQNNLPSVISLITNFCFKIVSQLIFVYWGNTAEINLIQELCSQAPPPPPARACMTLGNFIYLCLFIYRMWIIVTYVKSLVWCPLPSK